MKKLWIGMMLMVAALAGTAQAALLAEFTFDTDAADTAGGHDGIVTSGTVAGGVLTLDAGGYMDLAATFGAVNPFDGSGDFRIEMDYKTTAACTLIGSASSPTSTSVADMTVYMSTTSRLWYDNYFAGDKRINGTFGNGEWQTLVVTYDADGTGGTAPLITITSAGVTGTASWNPAIPDIALDTVRIGGTVNDSGGYEDAPAGLAFDNIRIYDTVIPEPVSHAPSFASDPINEIDATKDVAYSSTLADDASDPDSDPMTFTFSTVSGPGPSWLVVAPDGTLSGTPGAANIGAHVFTVQVDTLDGSDTATLNINVADAVLPTGPPAQVYYTFDNDVNDRSGNLNHGTLTGGTFSTNRPEGSHSLSLDGSDDYVTVPDLSSSAAITFTTWVNPNALSKSYNALLHTSGWSTGGMHLLLKPSGVIQCSVKGTPDCLSASALPVGSWSHLAIVYDSVAKKVDFYIDGTLDVSRTYTSAVSVTPNGARIGSWDGGGRDFDGFFDDTRIYNTALTDTEVNEIYNGGTPPEPPPPPEPPELGPVDFSEILYVQRLSFASDHFYTDFINYNPAGLFSSDNGIYRYNLETKAIVPVITAADMPGGQGVFFKFDLDFDASRVVFDYKESVETGFRIWMCNIDGSDLTQITTTPPDEAANIAEYYMPGQANMGTFNFHYDDMHPVFTQDDTIIFTSTRCKYTTLCNQEGSLVTPVIHRVNLDGSGLEKMTDSPVSEFAPSMMEDGRVVYTRWEYVDKDSLYCKAGYAMNPDGTHVNEIFGLDQHSPATLTYFRQIPGKPNKFVCVGAPHYPQGDNLGPILVVDRTKEVRSHEDPNNPTPAAAVTYVTPDVRVWSEPGWHFQTSPGSWTRNTGGSSGKLYTTPYPIDEERFLVTCKANENDPWNKRDAYSIAVIDMDGNHTPIVSVSGTSLWNPVPMKTREKPMRINALKFPAHLLPGGNPNLGLALVTDVYQGMDGVARGDVKYLRVNVVVSRPWSAHRINLWSPSLNGAQWASRLWPQVQMGIVPVYDDGSAYFAVPADRNVMLQALDSEYREIQRERTYVNYRPGEFRSCVGCHDASGKAPPEVAAVGGSVMALQQGGPSVPAPMPGEAAGTGDWAGWGVKVIYYPHDIQPILDDNCISCHSSSGGQTPYWTGEVTGFYTASYDNMKNGRYCGPLVNENNDNMTTDLTQYEPPKHFGSYASTLSDKIHNDPAHRARLTDEERYRISRWIDANYQFYGTYYGRHRGDHAAHPNFRVMPTVEEALSTEAPAWHQ